MNILLSVLIVFCFLQEPLSAEAASEINVAGRKKTVQSSDFMEPPREVVMSLVRTDRMKRDWKTLWLVPGKEKTWFYSYLQKDGGTIIKEATHKLPGVRDERPLKERRPNCYIVLESLNFSIPPTLGAATTLLGVKGKL